MKRETTYTAAPTGDQSIVRTTDEGAYRDTYTRMPFVTRLWYATLSWLRGQTVEETIQRTELSAIAARLRTEQLAISGTTLPTLSKNVTTQLAGVRAIVAGLKPVLDQAAVLKKGAFLQFVVASFHPDSFRAIDQAFRIPQEVFADPSASPEDADADRAEAVRRAVTQEREILRSDVSETWAAVVALHRLAEAPIASLLPARKDSTDLIPLKTARDSLVTVYRAIEVCKRVVSNQSIRMLAVFADKNHYHYPARHDELWSLLVGKVARLPWVDLIRLAFEDPRLEIAAIDDELYWEDPVVAAWTDRINSGEEIFRHREQATLAAVTEAFGEIEIDTSWIPVTMYPRTMTALRHLTLSRLFTTIQAIAGAVAREEGLLPGVDRQQLLADTRRMDEHLHLLEHTIGDGERSGSLGDEIKIIARENPDRAAYRIEIARIEPRVRQSLSEIVQGICGAAQAFSTALSSIRAQVEKENHVANLSLADSINGTGVRAAFTAAVDTVPPIIDSLLALYEIEHRTTQRE